MVCKNIAAKARIKQGEQFSCMVGASIEFTCDSIGFGNNKQQQINAIQNNNQQTYWYFNGNLLNYNAHANQQQQQQDQDLLLHHNQQQQQQQHSSQSNLQHHQPRNFTIERDFMSQTSRFKLFNVQTSDSGNYTCKPTSAEPATIRLTVKSLYPLATLSLSKTLFFKTIFYSIHYIIYLNQLYI